VQQFTNEIITDLLAAHPAPCISLYQPTHRRRPDTAQDPIRFRNLLAEAERSLRQNYPGRDVRALLSPLRAYERDSAFWDNQLDGLALFAAPDSLRIVQLQRPVPARVVVAASFHLKPLLRITQSADRFRVLCLSREHVALHEGNRYVLDPVETGDVPRSLVEALGDERSEPHLTVSSYGGAGGPGMHHGHGSKKDEDDIDLERYFRVLDRALNKHLAGSPALPLILAALPHPQAGLRRISNPPNRGGAGNAPHPDSLDTERLRAAAWRILEPEYQSRLAGVAERYRLAQSRDAGSDDVAQIGPAAVQGRVELLLVAAESHLPGRIDPATGAVTLGADADPELDDVCDDLAERVLATGGAVYVVPAELMPSQTGAAAIFRF
jgi:hypothetical protein